MGSIINPTVLTREQQAALNNLRAILTRQLRVTSTTDPTILADLILQNALFLRENGFAAELLEYLQRIREKQDSGKPLYTRLNVEIAVTLAAMDGRQDEAAKIFETALNWYQTHPTMSDETQAHLAYGRFLVNRSQFPAAMSQFQQALELSNERPIDAVISRSEMGRVLVGQGRFGEALPHFERAYTGLQGDEQASIRVRLTNDFATALIEVGDTDRAEKLLVEGIDVATRHGLWLLRANLRRQVAYIYHRRAEKSSDANSAQPYLDEAERLLNQAVAELLPLHQSLDLAVAYHDLGRIEAQQRRFVEADAYLQLCLEMFRRLGNVRNEAVAEITLGTVVVLKDGNIAAGNGHLHRALQLAEKVGDQFTLRQAAETLTRLHQLQVTRAKTQPHDIRLQVIDQLSFSRARLAEFSLGEAAQALQKMMAELEAMPN